MTICRDLSLGQTDEVTKSNIRAVMEKQCHPICCPPKILTGRLAILLNIRYFAWMHGYNILWEGFYKKKRISIQKNMQLIDKQQ
jgi:hypothetical protein